MMVSKKKKRKQKKTKGIEGAVNDAYNTIHKCELIVKEIKHTNNIRKFRESISLKRKLNIYSCFNDSPKFSYFLNIKTK